MLHTDWSTPSFLLPPTAPRTGPFPCRPFLETWWRHRGGGDGGLVIADSGDGLAALVLSDGVLTFAGDADLTDYHAPLGPGASTALAEALTAAGASSFLFDSLPEESAAVVAKALADVGIQAEPHPHQVAAVLDLPDGYEAWLAALPKKERHEVRRKRRRFVEELGEPRLVRDEQGLPAFAAMHRAASGEKGAFMDPAMEHFFAALATDAGFVVDLLIAGTRTVAAAVGHEGEDGYFLYNSAYDPAVAAASPGVVLLTEVIASQIERGSPVLDFMKGDEAYKFRLGARPRRLFAFEGGLP